MTNDPAFAAAQVPRMNDPAKNDPVTASVSMSEFARTTHIVPRPASMTLDVARHHAFTGEVVFQLDPRVSCYFDGGVAYFAEVADSQSVSDQLVGSGVIDSPQLERGVVRVGDLEHLGRLFDRDASIDRDAVMLVVEHHTEQLLTLLASDVVAAVEINPYRHHPSGIHRWFVQQADSVSSSRPLSDVAQVDRSVVDDLPGLWRSESSLSIEWTEPDPTGLGVPADAFVEPHAPTDADVQAELDRFDADSADWAGVPSGFVAPSTQPVASPLGEFHIVWPDGSQDPDLVSDVDHAATTETPAPAHPDGAALAPIAPESTAPAPPAPPAPESAAPPAPAPPPPAPAPIAPAPIAPVSNDSTMLPALAAPPNPPAPTLDPIRPLFGDPATSEGPAAAVPTPQPVVPAAPPTGLIAPLHLDEIPTPDAAIPDDVAAAVKRALQAMDEASGNPIVLPTRTPPSFTLPKISEAPAPTAPPAAPAPVAAAPVRVPPIVVPTLSPEPVEPPPPAPVPAPAPAPVAPVAAAPVPAAPSIPAPVDQPLPAQQPVVADVAPAAPPPPPPVPTAPEAAPMVGSDGPVLFDDEVVIAPSDDSVLFDDEPAMLGADEAAPVDPQTSVVFADDDAAGRNPSNERRSALSRLIKSIRNTD